MAQGREARSVALLVPLSDLPGHYLLWPEAYAGVFKHDPGVMYNRATKEFIDRWGYDLAPEDPPQPYTDYQPRDINSYAEGKERDDEDQRRRDFRLKLHEVRARF